MITFLLFLGAIGYYASKSVPSLAILQAQLKGNPTGLTSRLVQRLFTAEPAIRMEHYVVCAVAYVTSPGLEATYLGVFHQWWRISEIQEVSGTGGRGGGFGSTGTSSDKAEALQEEAVQAKKAKQYGRAGDLYTQAAREYLSGDLGKESMVDASELAGQCYEEASKCSKQAGRKEDASALLDKAIEAYKKNPNRISWAATMAERKATLWLEGRGGAEGTRAAKAFSQAAELYEQADDGRARFTRAKEGDAWAKVGRYAEGFKAYENSLDKSSQHNSSGTEALTLPPRYLCALLCFLGTGAGWEEVQGKMGAYFDQCPTFRSSPEARFMSKLCEMALEKATRAEVESHCQGYRSGRMEPWQTQVLQKVAVTLEGPADESFR